MMTPKMTVKPIHHSIADYHSANSPPNSYPDANLPVTEHDSSQPMDDGLKLLLSHPILSDNLEV
jgi:hypothetical protein